MGTFYGLLKGETGTDSINVFLPTDGTPVNGVAAVGTLTVGGVVLDGDTATIGIDTYEFAADTAQTVTAGNIAVDITAVTTASTTTLTIDTQVTATNTMTIGDKPYTFVADGEEADDGDISVGSDLADGLLNIVAAINGTDGINTASEWVTAGAFANDDSLLTALVGGVIGDSIATTETFSAVTNIFTGVVLANGADCTAANAITALVAAEDADALYTLADAAGDTMTVTYNTKGIVGNSVATTETFTTAGNVFDATRLGTTVAGVDCTVAKRAGQCYANTTYLYYYVGTPNTTNSNGWRRVALGSAY